MSSWTFSVTLYALISANSEYICQIAFFGSGLASNIGCYMPMCSGGYAEGGFLYFMTVIVGASSGT